MSIETKLPSDSIIDQPNNLKEYDYVNAVAGYALLLTVTVVLTTWLGCCRTKNTNETTTAKVENQKASTVANVDSHSHVDKHEAVVIPNHYSASTFHAAQTRSGVADVDSHSHAAKPTFVVPPYHSRQAPSANTFHATQASTRVADVDNRLPSTFISPTAQTGSRDTTTNWRMAAPPKPRGLINNGNTCYFNSVMQALNHTSILENQLGEIRELGKMIKRLTQFYASMNGSETSAFDPQRLLNLLFRRTGKFIFGMQHDSHECLLNILHELRNDERQGRADRLTVVDKIFGGHCMTVYKCEACRTPTHLCEPFLDISLPIAIPSLSSPRKSRKGSAKRSHSGDPHAPRRQLPVPPVDGFKQGNPQEHEVNVARDVADRDLDLGNKDERHGEHKRKNQTGDGSRERRTKIQKREFTQHATFNEPEPTRKQNEEYKRAVSLMMSTLPKVREKEPSNLCTLDDCFRCYTREEHIIGEYLCRECNPRPENESDIRLTSATKRTLIYNPPAVLTIHLKRFESTSKGYVKRTTMVQYDEVLDIGPYCTAWWNDSQSKSIGYSLYAVVVHSGSLESGHYIAYVKVREYDHKIIQFLQKTYLNRDDITVESLIHMMKNNQKSGEYSPYTERLANKEGIWYRMNDHSVRIVSAQEALNQEAFLLFYERVQKTTEFIRHL